MRPNLRRLALSIPFLLVWFSAAGSVESTAPAAVGAIAFQTLDGDVQEVEVSEIWRIRGTAGREEPPGAVVVDFAFERLFVKDSLDAVVSRVANRRKVERFTLPSGTPIYIVADKVIGIMRAIPGQHHDRSKSLIMAREGQQQVQESREEVRAALQE